MSSTFESTVHKIPKDSSGLFEWIMNRYVHEYLDVEGRPVGEGRSMAYDNVHTEFKTCPYPGSRHEHAYPMNDSALRDINPHWQNILKLLGLLSHRYQASEQTQVSTYYDLALVAGSGVFLSDFLALRQHQPVASNHYPVLITGLYKVCLGFQQATFLAMMNDQFKPSDEDRLLPSAAEFYQTLEDNQMLVGEGEVCGGSAAMIKRAFQTMQGTGAAVDDTYSSNALSKFDVDWKEFDRFSSDASNLWRKSILFVIQLQDFCPVIQDNGEIDSERRQFLNGLLKEDYDYLIQQQSGLVAEIAHLTVDESGRPLKDWLNSQSSFLEEISYDDKLPRHDKPLVESILKRLTISTQSEAEKNGLQVAVELQVKRYLALEVAILNSFNTHIQSMQRSLGEGYWQPLVSATDLSAMCGGSTLRDWPDLKITASNVE